MSTTRCLPLDESSLTEAADLLRAGQLVAFPTETVYGLGADASNPQAVARIFEAKGRPADHPVIVHLADGADPLEWAASWSPLARQLADVFWPGPLTLIVPRHERVSALVTGGQDTVGLRCPGHPGAQALLRYFGGGIAAPSANRFGRISPTCAAHVMEELSGRIPLVLDGGDAPVGIESTIIDVSRGYAVLLRPGDLCAQDIEQAIGQRLARHDANAPRVSGSLESHYAPERPVQLIEAAALPDMLDALGLTGGLPVAVLAWTDAVLDALARQGFEMITDYPVASTTAEPSALLTLSGQRLGKGKGLCHIMPADPHALAHELYAALRWADHQPVRGIVVEKPPQSVTWEGVADRLRRAAASRR